MPLTQSSNKSIQDINDQLRVSVRQGLSQVMGPNSVIKFLDGNIQVEKLEPVGQKIIIRLVVDVYPGREDSPA